MTKRPRMIIDSDALALRKASRIVGTRIAIVCSAVVLIVIAAIFIYVLSEISPAELFEPVPDQNNLNVGAVDLLRAAATLGVALIILAGVMSWLVTRRAVQPLGEALRIQRAFVADASHELRTPLAVLDARIQILQRTLPVGDPSSELVAELRHDAKSLIQIVNDLLESAELGGVARQQDSTADVVVAVDKAVHAMRLLGEERDVTIALEAPQSAHSYVPAPSITRCAVALIDNALRFAPPGTLVTVSVVATSKNVKVLVRDHGAGIRGIDPARIFDRFAHSGSASDGGNETQTGFGIGLALVREIAMRHGGSVAVSESLAAGTVISFAVPAAKHR